MKPARLVVAGIAGVSGLIALMLSGQKPIPKEIIADIIPHEEKKTEILVVARAVELGAILKETDLAWIKWPADIAAPNMIQRSVRPEAIAEFKGGAARSNFVENEPVLDAKVIKGAGSGFLSALLTPGMRAVAIPIDGRGASSAGGFILPNDRVDVILTRRDSEASSREGGDIFESSTILKSIRVLAIGQNITEHNGDKVIVGENATLELSPYQAELVTQSSRTGSLSLILRSFSDNKVSEEVRKKEVHTGITIVRFGASQEVSR